MGSGSDCSAARMATPTTAEHWQVHEQRYQRMLAPFTDHLPRAAARARADRVLDIGCGTGSATPTAGDLAGNEGSPWPARRPPSTSRTDGVWLESRAWLVTAHHPRRAEGNP
jgi:SAM-dependent methyltransferase